MTKKKLTLSVDEKIIKSAKKKALDYDCSVSELFEYFIKAAQKNKDLLHEVVKKSNNSS